MLELHSREINLFKTSLKRLFLITDSLIMLNKKLTQS